MECAERVKGNGDCQVSKRQVAGTRSEFGGMPRNPTLVHFI